MINSLDNIQYCDECKAEIHGDVCPQCIEYEKGWDLPFIRVKLKRFTPNFTELTLYSMALTVALVLIFYKESGKLLSSVLDQEEALFIIGYLGVGVLTLWLCIYHAFVRKRKSELEKNLMLTFAMGTNFIAGILAGTYAYEHTVGVYALFPAINIANCVLLAVFRKFEIITIDNISDENVPLWQVATSTITVLIVFIIFKAYLDRQWYFTFSACVFYATNINRPVILAIENLSRKKRITTTLTRTRQKSRRSSHA